MAWPPAVIASDKNNATAMVNDHAVHHNALADAVNDTVAEILNGVQASRSLIRQVKNASGGTLVRGDVVRVAGAVGENITVTKAQAGANVPNPPSTNVVFGIVKSASINDNANGDIIINGVLKDLDTSAWPVGTFLYLSASTAGALTATPPSAPNEIVCLALVTKQDATEGQICMQVAQPVHLNTVVGFNVGTLTDGDALVWDAASGTFVNQEPGAGLGGTSYIYVAGNGTAAENGAELQAAYAAAKALTPYGNALSNTNRAWVVVGPGVYDTTLVMDGEFVNVVSLDGDMSLRLTGIDVQADNVLVRGIDVGTAVFTIGDDLAGLVAEKCKGGLYSFGGDPSNGSNPLVVSGTFTDCSGGDGSFGRFGIVSGTFTNCTAEGGQFGGEWAFGGNGEASGIFINCTGGMGSFGSLGTTSGTFIDCTAGNSSFNRAGVGASGIFTNCTAGNDSFGRNSAASGTFTNCTAGNDSFGHRGAASGTFAYCTGGFLSFGGNGTASGTFTNCTAGQLSFGTGTTLSGNVLWCRLTSGTFPSVSGAGKIRMSLDGTFTEINQG